MRPYGNGWHICRLTLDARREAAVHFSMSKSWNPSAQENFMNGTAIRNALLVFVLAGAVLAIGCGGGAEGKYRDPSGTINAEFKDGKAYVALGAYAVDGTYKVEGDKIVARGDFGPMLPSPLVFTINKDGTIDGPRNSMIPRLEKAK
jgi:hypothetical protein